MSKGMKQVVSILKQLKDMRFIQNYDLEKTFKEMRYNKNGRLFADVYIKELNAIIEYDGEQHFKPIEFFGGQEEFILRMRRDLAKDIFCLKYGKSLLRIPHTIKLNQIPVIIVEFFKQCKEKLIYCSYEHYSNNIDPELKKDRECIIQKMF